MYATLSARPADRLRSIRSCAALYWRGMETIGGLTLWSALLRPDTLQPPLGESRSYQRGRNNGEAVFERRSHVGKEIHQSTGTEAAGNVFQRRMCARRHIGVHQRAVGH